MYFTYLPNTSSDYWFCFDLLQHVFSCDFWLLKRNVYNAQVKKNAKESNRDLWAFQFYKKVTKKRKPVQGYKNVLIPEVKGH